MHEYPDPPHHDGVTGNSREAVSSQSCFNENFEQQIDILLSMIKNESKESNHLWLTLAEQTDQVHSSASESESPLSMQLSDE